MVQRRGELQILLTAAMAALVLPVLATPAAADPVAAYVETVVVADSANDAADTKSVRAACPAGTRVLGGGVRTVGVDGLLITTNRPGSGLDYWEAGAREPAPGETPWQVHAYAICGDAPGLRFEENGPIGSTGGVGGGGAGGRGVLLSVGATWDGGQPMQMGLATDSGSQPIAQLTGRGPYTATLFAIWADSLPDFPENDLAAYTSYEGTAGQAGGECPAGTRLYGIGAWAIGHAEDTNYLAGQQPRTDASGGDARSVGNPGTLKVWLTCAKSATPTAELSPTATDFGAVPEGVTSPPATFTLRNTGESPLRVDRAALGGANAGDYSVGSDECSGRRVAPGSTCTISVTFTPGAPGVRSASLTLTHNAGTSNAALTGTGATADVAIGLTARPQLGVLVPALAYTVRVTNAGPADIRTVLVEATLPAGLTGAQSENCVTSVPGKVSCTFSSVRSGATATANFRLPLRLLKIGKITVVASRVSSLPADPNPANDTASVSCEVVGPVLVVC